MAAIFIHCAVSLAKQFTMKQGFKIQCCLLYLFIHFFVLCVGGEMEDGRK